MNTLIISGLPKLSDQMLEAFIKDCQERIVSDGGESSDHYVEKQTELINAAKEELQKRH